MEATKHFDMDTAVEVHGWAARWLARTYTVLHWETIGVCYALSTIALLFNICGLVAQYRARRALVAQPDSRALTFRTLDRRMQWTTAGIYRLACMYMAHIFAIWAVDGGISVVTLYSLATDDSVTFDLSSIFALIGFGLTCIGTLLAVYILVPMAQMWCMAFLVSRFYRKTEATTLAAYIPEARLLTTHMAFIWSMLTFFIMAFWSPMADDYFTRQLLLQGAVGSAWAWLDASYCFNFRAEHLEDVELVWPGVTGIVRLFGKKMAVMHTYSEKAATKDGLPQYVAGAQHEAEVGEE